MTFAITLLGLSAAFTAGPVPVARRVSLRAPTVAMNDVLTTLASLQGPEIFWGSEGVAFGKEESDIKGYDNFGKFVQAIQAAGLTADFQGPGPITVFAPTDAAMDSYGGMLSPDVIKYHVVPGNYPVAAIQGNLQTLQGSALTYGRRFRKTFVDYAMVGVTSSGASKGAPLPERDCWSDLAEARPPIRPRPSQARTTRATLPAATGSSMASTVCWPPARTPARAKHAALINVAALCHSPPGRRAAARLREC